MDIRLKKALADAIGLKKFVPFGIDEDSWKYRGGKSASVEIPLQRMSKPQLKDLTAIFEEKKKLRGVQIILRDIATYHESVTNVKGAKARTVKQFETILTGVLAKCPGHRLYARKLIADSDDVDEESEIPVDTTEAAHKIEEIWLTYYVNYIEYEPAVEYGDRRHPAYTRMYLLYQRYGGKRATSVDFYEGDCRGMNAVEALAEKGFYLETPEMRSDYKRAIEKFGIVTGEIGKQYLAVGLGVDDPDGNTKGRDNSWYWRGSHNIDMVRNGEPSRVVVDLFYEDRDKDRDRVANHVLRPYYWPNKIKGRKTEEEEEAEEDDDNLAKIPIEEMPDDDDTTDEKPIIEIPIHPWLVVFDLAKHLRLRVHIDQLTEYQYDRSLADKLILSNDRKALIKLLIETKQSGFKDIVRGKAGGSVVLLTGPPGVGKTLTAEVYAESEGRALYSIQCSQLGIDPECIEDQLLKTFARARRWNAVMLLDEADVYVHERGNDLQQNAIVGVFLRVLEYQSSVLFLTTNRPDDVDDAIASRCIARLDYILPDKAEQKQIWEILAAGCDAKIDKATLNMVANHFGEMSGRDIKNIIKLARVMAQGAKINIGMIEFVSKFKPTGQRET